MPLTAAERRTRRQAVNRAVRRANSSVDLDCDGDSESDGADSAALAHSDSDDSESEGTDGAALARSDNDERRPRRRAVTHAARRANSSVDFDCDGDSESDAADGAALGHSDSDDSDSDGVDDAFAAKPNDGARSPVAALSGGRSDSDNSNDGPVRPFPTPPRTSCPTATLLRALLLAGLLC